MTDASPTDGPSADAPSLAALIKATGVAFVIAVVLLVLVVLPAEYDVDVTGFGRAIGLTVLSKPAPEPAPEATDASEIERDDQTVVDVPAGKGVEYKFHLRGGQKMKYSWNSNSSELFYDFHGEPKGAASNVFESFAAGKASLVKGTFTAPFDGTHGWYWKNSSPRPVQITLETSGTYEIVGLK
jgi:hypothetical protein